MTIARDTTKDEIISGEELRELGADYVSSTHFECPSRDCRATATPCSYNDFNKPRSYFRYLENHLPNCGLHETEETDTSPRSRRSVKNTNNMTLHYINRLNLEAFKRKPDEPSKSDVHSTHSAKKPDLEDAENEQRTHHCSAASSIRPIVNWFLNNPDKGTYTINITGVRVNRYRTLFRSIFYSDKFRFIGKHIYYGSLWLNQDFSERNGHLLVKLVQGKNEHNKYHVDIDMSDWKKGQKDLILEDITEAKKEAIAYRKKSKNDKSAWIFFLGEPDKDKSFLFHVSDHRLIYIQFCQKPSLPTHNEGLDFFKKTDANPPLKKLEKDNKTETISNMLPLETPIISNFVIPTETKPESKPYLSTSNQGKNILPPLTSHGDKPPNTHASSEEKIYEFQASTANRNSSVRGVHKLVWLLKRWVGKTK